MSLINNSNGTMDASFGGAIGTNIKTNVRVGSAPDE